MICHLYRLCFISYSVFSLVSVPLTSHHPSTEDLKKGESGNGSSMVQWTGTSNNRFYLNACTVYRIHQNKTIFLWTFLILI